MSAMWMGSVDRLLPPLLRRASRSIELMSPRISRRLASSRSRKCSSSLAEKPAWFFRGFSLLATGGGRGPAWPGRAASAAPARTGRRFPLSALVRALALPAGWDLPPARFANALALDLTSFDLEGGLAFR